MFLFFSILQEKLIFIERLDDEIQIYSRSSDSTLVWILASDEKKKAIHANDRLVHTDRQLTFKILNANEKHYWRGLECKLVTSDTNGIFSRNFISFFLFFFFFFFIVLSRLEYTRRSMRLVHDAELNVPEVLFTMVF